MHFHLSLFPIIKKITAFVPKKQGEAFKKNHFFIKNKLNSALDALIFLNPRSNDIQKNLYC